MSKTSLLLVGALSICGLAVAGTKSYSITLAAAAKVGPLQLAAGDYKLKIEGANAIFTEPVTRKTFTAPIKIETSTHKFPYTAVETAPDGGSERVTSIDLGGSTTQVEFPK
jgi:hypothetical protein